MHFNEVLVRGLKFSDSVKEWESLCKKEITIVTGDDVSLSLLAIGFKNFKDLKEAFAHSSIAKMEEIKNAQDEIKSLSKKIDDYKASLEILIQKSWDEYKISYMKFFNDVEEAVDEGSCPSRENASHENEPVKEETISEEGLNSESSESTTETVTTITAPILKTEKSVVGDNEAEVCTLSIEEADSSIKKLDAVTPPAETESKLSKTEVLEEKEKAINNSTDSDKSGFPPIRVGSHSSKLLLKAK